MDRNEKCMGFILEYRLVGNGRFNIDKVIEDIKWIIDKEISTAPIVNV